MRHESSSACYKPPAALHSYIPFKYKNCYIEHHPGKSVLKHTQTKICRDSKQQLSCWSSLSDSTATSPVITKVSVKFIKSSWHVLHVVLDIYCCLDHDYFKQKYTAEFKETENGVKGTKHICRCLTYRHTNTRATSNSEPCSPLHACWSWKTLNARCLSTCLDAKGKGDKHNISKDQHKSKLLCYNVPPTKSHQPFVINKSENVAQLKDWDVKILSRCCQPIYLHIAQGGPLNFLAVLNRKPDDHRE